MRILQRCLNIFARLKRKHSEIAYWEQRAIQYGVRSVLNLEYSETEIEAVTRAQKETLFPVFKQHLKGDEALVLDFGCGPGRFTPDLAIMIQGRAIGVDPVKTLLDLAPQNESVEYRVIKNGVIPLENNVVDVAWVCLVLGGIVNQGLLQRTIDEIDRVLKNDGLLFLVENTSENESQEHWIFRSVSEYQALFKFVHLRHLSDYDDLGECISIMAGRKRV